MEQSLNQIENTIADLEKSLAEVKRSVSQLKATDRSTGQLILVPYFTYTTTILRDQQSIQITASFIIKNLGSIKVHNPYICIRIKPNDLISFTAKIASEVRVDSSTSQLLGDTWTYINHEASDIAKNNGEYWLMPLSNKSLSPNESLSFFNFQLTIPLIDEFMVEGYIYGDELKTGQASLNKIRVYSY